MDSLLYVQQRRGVCVGRVFYYAWLAFLNSLLATYRTVSRITSTVELKAKCNESVVQMPTNTLPPCIANTKGFEKFYTIFGGAPVVTPSEYHCLHGEASLLTLLTVPYPRGV